MNNYKKSIIIFSTFIFFIIVGIFISHVVGFNININDVKIDMGPVNDRGAEVYYISIGTRLIDFVEDEYNIKIDTIAVLQDENGLNENFEIINSCVILLTRYFDEEYIGDVKNERLFNGLLVFENKNNSRILTLKILGKVYRFDIF